MEHIKFNSESVYTGDILTKRRVYIIKLIIHDAKYPLRLTHHQKTIVLSTRRLFIVILASRKRYFILTKHSSARILNNPQATHVTPLCVCPYRRNVPNIPTNWPTWFIFTPEFLDDSVRLVHLKQQSSEGSYSLDFSTLLAVVT
jgi:hypothetical protein